MKAKIDLVVIPFHDWRELPVPQGVAGERAGGLVVVMPASSGPSTALTGAALVVTVKTATALVTEAAKFVTTTR